MTDTSGCSTCGKTKANQTCGLCLSKLCKNCTQFLPPDTFQYLSQIPMEFSHSTYCGYCMADKVSPYIESYQVLLSKAREVLVFDRSQGKETRLIKRTEPALELQDCADYNEMILKMAVLATQMGFNSLVDLTTQSKKTKNGSYSITSWSGSAVPANVSEKKLLKDRSLWSNPN